MEEAWDSVLTDPTDREVYRRSRQGQPHGLGVSPVLLVVDATYAFTGDADEPVVDSMRKWRTSCGQRAWRALPRIAELVSLFHRLGRPVISSRAQERGGHALPAGLWRSPAADDAEPAAIEGNRINEMVSPGPDDLVIEKSAPSVFFGTPLTRYLVSFLADSVVICGGSTSGCVRATAVDAFSYNFNVAVAEDACFDRLGHSHRTALFELNSRYADVLRTDDIIGQLEPRS